MNRLILQIKKRGVRILMCIGAALGITACSHPKINPSAPECVYGPPPGTDTPNIEVIEDVYGPPVEIDTAIKPEPLVYGPPPGLGRETPIIVEPEPKSKPDTPRK